MFLDDGSLPGDSDLDFSKLVWKENKKDGSLYYFFKNKPEKYLPLFLVKETNGYIIPISGKGLWSTIKGFIYIIPVRDQESYVSGQFAVKGISFYEHGETPGLGGEIDKYDIKKRYLDKQINLKEQKTPNMTKAIVDERYELEYISGATITSDGLDSFIASHILGRYKNILINDVHTSKVDYE